MRAKPVGINHVALEVGNVDEALEFYGRIFELCCAAEPDAWRSSTSATSSSRSPRAGRHPTTTATSASSSTTRERALEAAREAGADVRGRIRDPWGNNVEVVAYEDVQFTKAPEILRGMGLEGLEKTEQAREELRTKGLG